MAVMIPEIVDAVDVEESQFESLSNGMPRGFTAPPVLQWDKLRGFDLLMCLHVNDWLCSWAN